MRVSKAILLAFSFAVLSCTKGVEEVKLSSSEMATFLADPVSASGEVGTTDGTFSNIPTSRLANFQVCLKDVAVLEPVVGASFRLREGSREIPLKSSFTDAKGCLYWSENFPFQATQQETYFELVRTIEALTVHKGAVSVRLAVNPWKKGPDAVKDLRFQSAPPALDRSRSQNSRAASPGLVIETVQTELEIMRSQDAVAEADLRLAFEPKLRRIGIDGSQILETLTSGKFRVRVQILASNGGESFPLTNVADFGEGAFQKGLVQLRSRVKVLRKIPREAVLELSFEAIPVEAPEGLGSVRGRVSLGRLTSLSLSRAAPLYPETEAAFLEAPAPKQEGANFFGFEMGKVRASDVVVKALDGTGHPSLLEVEFTACLRNSFSQEKILGQEFALDFSGFATTQSTDPEGGCLKWKQDFPFDYHARETLLKRELQVAGANSFYGKEKIGRALHLNLWKYEQPDKIVIDEEFDGEPSPGVAAGGSELFLASSFYNFMGRTFEVDSHLNLSTTRTYRFEFQPKIRRMSRNQGWLPAQGVGNGRYQVRFLLETLDPDNPQVVDAQTVEAESRADIMPVTVSFRIHDVRLVNTRLNLSIEVIPVDRASSLKTMPFAGTFDMTGFSIRLEPRNGRIEERMKLARRDNPALKKRSAQIFAETKGHTWLGEAKLKEIGMSAEELQKAIQSRDPSAARKLCSLYFEKPGWFSLFSSYSACTSRPERLLYLAQTEHVAHVKKSRIATNAQTSTISMNAGIMFTEYDSNDRTKSHSRSWNVDAGAKIGAPLKGITGLDIGIGVGYNNSWTTSDSYTTGRSRSEMRSGDLTRQLNVDEVEFELQGEVDKCLVIANRADLKDKVYFVCQAKPEAKTFRESYYLVYQQANPGAMIDAGASLEERPFLSLLRGKARFLQFVKVVQDPEATLNLRRTLPAPAEVMREADNRYDGFFPGLLTPAE